MRRVVMPIIASAVLFVAACGSSDDEPVPAEAFTSSTPSATPTTSRTPTPAATTTPVPVAPTMTPGALGPVKAGDPADEVLATGLFRRAAKPCVQQRLDLVGGGIGGPTLVLREEEQRVVLINAGRTGRTSTGAGVGTTVTQLRAAYGTTLLKTEVTGPSGYLKVVDGRRILQFNLRAGAVRTMYTYDTRDWSNLAPGPATAPEVYLDGLGGLC